MVNPVELNSTERKGAETIPPIADAQPGEIRATAGSRWIALIVAALCLALLIVAWRLTPDGTGMGTHKQLGLPACGWVVAMNLPCPTCGMTTAFAAATGGRPGLAIWAQPFGALLAVAVAVVFWAALHVAVFGSMLGRFVERMLVGRVLWPTAALFAAAWIYKILQVRGIL